MGALDGLNREQRRAAEAVRGPVCILAGAGSGKTTTITHRIAHQVETRRVRREPAALAVTFTDKAAGELQEPPRRARRCRACAPRRSTRRRSGSSATSRPDRLGTILPSKALAPAPDREPAARAVQVPARGRPRDRDRVGEEPPHRARRLRARAEREPPIPLDLMQRVYREYERRKAAEGTIDFEDLLELAVQLFEEDEAARETFRRAVPRVHGRRVPGRQPAPADAARPLARRARRPLRRRRRLPVDLRVHRRGPRAPARRAPTASRTRSSSGSRRTTAPPLRCSQLANRLVPSLGGAEKTLRADAARRPGAGACAPSPRRRTRARRSSPRSARSSCPLEDVAVLARTNARLTDFEELLHDAGIPFQGASLLDREAARRLVPAARALAGACGRRPCARPRSTPATLERLPDKLGERELVRQQDLAPPRLARRRLRRRRGRVRRLAARPVRPGRRRRARCQPAHLPPREGARVRRRLPAAARRRRSCPQGRRVRRRARRGAAPPLRRADPRAKRVLWLSWSGKPSRFLKELGVAEPGSRSEPVAECGRRRRRFCATGGSSARRPTASPPYVVFHDSVLQAIAAAQPGVARRARADPGRRPGEARALRRRCLLASGPALRAAGRASAADRGARGRGRRRRASAGRARADR